MATTIVTMFLALFATVSPAAAQATVTCYAVADGDVNNDGLNNETVPDTLVRIDDVLGAPSATIIGAIGAVGSDDAEAMAIRRGDATPIYAWENGTGLFTIDPTTGVSQGAASFQVGGDKVEGLGWANTDDADLSNDVLYVIRTNGDVQGYNASGVSVFGPTNVTAGVLNEGADVAWDPVTDTVYAIITNNADVSEIVVVTGGGPTGGPTDLDMEGLGFTADGQMIGTTGNDGADALHTIDKASGAAALVIDLEAATSVFDHEDVDCTPLEFDPGVITGAVTDECVADDGKITATVTYVSGELPVDYSVTITGQAGATGTISPGDAPAMEMQAGLADGNYTVVVTDTTNNTELANTVVAIACDPSDPGVLSSAINVTCVDDDGKVTVTINYVSGDLAADYSVALTGQTAITGTIDAANTPTMAMFSGLADGSYTLTVTNTTSNVQVAQETIPVSCDPAPGIANAAITSECVDVDGKITATVAYVSGEAPVDYSVAISGFAPQVGTVSSANPTEMAMQAGLADGTYTVTVTDTTNNTLLASASEVIACDPDPGSIIASASTEVVGDGTCKMTVTVSFAGGGLPVDYTVNVAGQTPVTGTLAPGDAADMVMFPGLASGSYAVTVTDDTNGGTVFNNTLTLAGCDDPGRIEGIVWEDADEDGQEGAAPTAIAGVTVNLWSTDAAGNPVAIIQTVTTNGAGAYGFNVGAGKYIVQVETPTGSTITTQDSGPDATDSDFSAGGLSPVLMVMTGMTITDIDAGIVPPPGEVTTVLSDSCVSGNGLISMKVTNTTDAAVTAVLKVAGLPDKTATVPAGAMVTLARSGRADGTYAVEGLIDGQSVFAQDVVVDCDPDVVETELLDSCVNNFGLITYKVTNNTSSDVNATLQVSGLPDKSTVVPAGTMRIVARSGRPDGSYTVVGLIDGAQAVSETVVFSGCSLAVPGTLGNRVWIDVDGDGQQEAGENGVIGATVNLWSTDANGAPVAIIDTVTTVAGGNYQFTNVTPGDYRIQVVAPNGEMFSPQNAGGNDFIDSDFDAAGISELITLASGQRNNTIDAGLVPDAPEPATIGNRVWDDTDADGIQELNQNGVIGVTVNLWSVDANGAPVAIVDTTTTGAGGLYSFSTAPGSYRIQVVAPQGKTFTAQNTGAENIDSDVDAAGISDLITVVSGQTDNTHDAGLIDEAPVSATIGNRIWEDSNRNGQQESGEPGVSGATVNLWTLDANGAPLSIIQSTTTNSRGQYQFTGVDPSQLYRVQFVVPGATFTTANSGSDFTDSDADAAGVSEIIDLTGKTRDNTIDAGIWGTPPFTYLVICKDLGTSFVMLVNNPTDTDIVTTMKVTPGPAEKTVIIPANTTNQYISVTGRPDGTYQIVATIDGQVVIDTMETVSCLGGPQ